MYIFEKTDNEMAGVYIIFKSPAKNETKKNYGISHLLEHMICEATDDLDEIYDENCIQTNAYTGKDEVVFYMTGLSSRVSQFKDDYINRILNYVPIEKDFKKQIPIVTQEYNDYFNDGFRSTFVNYMSKNFGMIYSIGTREALESLTFQDTVDFKSAYFSKPTMIIVADKNRTEVSQEYSNTTPATHEQYIYINKDAELNDKSMNYMMSSAPWSETSKDYNLRLIKKMLGYGLKSPLYQIRERDNLCYWVMCEDETIYNDNLLLISTSASIENKQKIYDGVFEVLYNPDKYLTKDRYNLIVNNTLASIETCKQYKHDFDWIHQYMDSDNISLAKNINRVNYDEMRDYYNQFILPSARNWNCMTQRELYD